MLLFLILLLTLECSASEIVQKPLQQRNLKDFPLAAMYYQDLYQKAARTREKLLYVAQDVASHFEGAEAIVPELKSFERAKDKVDLDYQGDWKKLTDLVRGSLSFQSSEDLLNGVLMFEKQLPMINIKDRINYPTPSGYRDVIALFQDPENGLIGEIQFHLCHILKAKNAEHLLYERIQAIERRAGIQHRDLNNLEKRRIEELRNEARDVYKNAMELVRKKVPCSIKAKL